MNWTFNNPAGMDSERRLKSLTFYAESDADEVFLRFLADCWETRSFEGFRRRMEQRFREERKLMEQEKRDA